MQKTSLRRYIVKRSHPLSPDTADTHRPGHRLPYLPAVDGLRAIAVLAVLLYHSDAAWLGGGFIGVEVFFVISGYLITASLLAEVEQTGSVALGAFWSRRARRLLPALGFFLVGTTVLAVAFAPDVVTKVVVEIPAALIYVYNWFAIGSGQSYFENFERPSFLQHLWSLAIEEQFYLLWPIVLLAGLKLIGRRGTFLVVTAGIAGSTLLMASMFVPSEDPSRLYYGTDTRMAGLLIGAALAFLWDPRRARRASTTRRTAPARIETLGVAGLAALAVTLVVLRDDAVGAPLLYGGGFFVVGIATAMTIAAVVMPGGRLAGILGNPLLRVIGMRSYAIYLWHWPIFLLTRPRVDVGLEGLELFALRLGLTLVMAEISHRIVEQPVRERRFLAGVEIVAVDLFRWRTLGRIAATVGAAALFLVALSGVQGDWRATIASAEARVAAATPEPAPLGEVVHVPVQPAAPEDSAGRQSGASGVMASADSNARDRLGSEYGLSDRERSAAPFPGRAAPLPPQPAAAGRLPSDAPEPTAGTDGESDAVVADAVLGDEVVAFNAMGDSVMLGAGGALEAIGLETVDARVGRQWWDAPEVAATMKRRGHVGDVFVLHLGHNGTLTAEMFDEVMAQLAEAERVVVVTVSLPRRWEASVNQELTAGVGRWGNAVLLDWQAIARGRPELTGSDGVHLSAAGRELYASAIAGAISE
jgi:peptidoglycan/LPS O-acetylase OafA/YrhL